MTTPNLNMPEIAASQSQKHVTHNEALALLDALVQLCVLSRVSDTPATPQDGARYIVPAGATGDFAGHEGKLAHFTGGAWAFYTPGAGWRAWVEDEGQEVVYSTGLWEQVGGAVISQTESGAQSSIVTVEEELSLSGASVSSSIVIPNRAVVFCVSSSTTAAVTGVTHYHVGISGEPQKFGGYLGITAGASNAGVIGPQAFYADTPVVITAEGDTGAFTGGKVRIALHYFLPSVPQI